LAGASSTARRSCSRGTGAGPASIATETPSTSVRAAVDGFELRGQPVDAVLEAVERLLDALQPRADRPQAAREAVDVRRRRQVERAHRRFLGLHGLLARGERARERAVDQRVLEQVRGELAECLLALPRQPVAQALFVSHPSSFIERECGGRYLRRRVPPGLNLNQRSRHTKIATYCVISSRGL
jgi:hypothetical protein